LVEIGGKPDNTKSEADSQVFFAVIK